jgi:hypothetical protein
MNRRIQRRSTLEILIGSVIQSLVPALIMFTLSAMRMVLLSVVVMWRSVPNAINDMADLWTQEAIDLGWPSIWGGHIKTLFWFLGLFVFGVGYILSAYITVGIFQLILHSMLHGMLDLLF